MLRFYNTLHRQVEPFAPLKEGEVGMYSCGPTVYNFATIGNLRAYVFVDLLKRYLKFCGYQVKHVMNITDVDDKTIRDSRAAGESLAVFTNRYTAAFLADLATLNIQLPDETPHASTHIQEMIVIIQKLLDKGLAYAAADGSVYFKIAADSRYGELAQLDRQQLKSNAEGRPNTADEYDKENASDFALWRAWSSEDGTVKWESPWGPGRPGWHIECSAMSTKYLGEQFDIHTGGVDLIFPHHTNEIAQSEGATGQQPFVKYWLHNAHLLAGGQKMSKSAGNFYTLRDLVEQGINPLLLRLFFIKNHYRQTIDYTPQAIEEAKGIAKRFLEVLIGVDTISLPNRSSLGLSASTPESEAVTAPHRQALRPSRDLVTAARKNFQDALDDDLNVYPALAALFEFMDSVNKSLKTMLPEEAQAVKNFLFAVDEVLGFIKPLYDQYQARLAAVLSDPAAKDLLARREVARAARDFKQADELRTRLAQKGLAVSDTALGQAPRLLDLV